MNTRFQQPICLLIAENDAQVIANVEPQDNEDSAPARDSATTTDAFEDSRQSLADCEKRR